MPRRGGAVVAMNCVKNGFMKEMDFGYVRVAAVTPRVNVADCDFNATQIIESVSEAAARGAKVIVTPELGITAYTCGDLFHQVALLDAAEAALVRVAEATAGLDALVVVGAPLRCGGVLYNCGVAMSHGKLLGAVPKT